MSRQPSTAPTPRTPSPARLPARSRSRALAVALAATSALTLSACGGGDAAAAPTVVATSTGRPVTIPKTAPSEAERTKLADWAIAEQVRTWLTLVPTQASVDKADQADGTDPSAAIGAASHDLPAKALAEAAKTCPDAAVAAAISNTADGLNAMAEAERNLTRARQTLDHSGERQAARDYVDAARDAAKGRDQITAAAARYKLTQDLL